jgi:hypothetical protein
VSSGWAVVPVWPCEAYVLIANSPHHLHQARRCTYWCCGFIPSHARSTMTGVPVRGPALARRDVYVRAADAPPEVRRRLPAMGRPAILVVPARVGLFGFGATLALFVSTWLLTCWCNA